MSAVFHFTTTTKALERNALVISRSQMERIIFTTAHEGSMYVWFEGRTVNHEINPGPEHRGIVGNESQEARFHPAWQPHTNGRRTSDTLWCFMK